MILDTTSDTFEILLGGTVATSQPTYVAHFNEMSSTTLVPKTSVGTTNNTTPVTLVSAPSSSFQRQLKFLNIENVDTAAVIVTVRFNNSSVTRTVFKATLSVGENLTYESEKGWNVSNSGGFTEFATTHVNKQGNIMLWEYGMIDGAPGSTSALGTTATIQSLGRIPKGNATSVNVLYRVAVLGGSFNWAELAIYKIGSGGAGCPNQARILTRMGSTSTTGVWNSTGIKNTQVSISDFNQGDQIYVLFAQSTTSTASLDCANLADQNSSSLVYGGNTTSATAWRPSLNFTYTILNFTKIPAILIYQIN